MCHYRMPIKTAIKLTLIVNSVFIIQMPDIIAHSLTYSMIFSYCVMNLPFSLTNYRIWFYNYVFHYNKKG